MCNTQSYHNSLSQKTSLDVIPGDSSNLAEIKPIHTVDQSNNYGIKIVTADFEAIIEPNGNNYIYMASWYNGSNSRIFDIKQFSNQKEFLTAFWSDLIANNKERTCYFHNWGGYDSILSLPYLLNLNSNLTFKPTVKDGELMALDIYEGRSHLFSIKDSIRILPGSLAKLAKDYKVPTQKEHFPHYFFLNNIQETLSYAGEIPLKTLIIFKLE